MAKNNHCSLYGYAMTDPEPTGSSDNVLIIQLIVERAKQKWEKATTDKIPVYCTGPQATFAQQYIKKGKRFSVKGEIRSYGDNINVLAKQLNLMG